MIVGVNESSLKKIGVERILDPSGPLSYIVVMASEAVIATMLYAMPLSHL